MMRETPDLQAERDATLRWLLTDGQTPFKRVTDVIANRHKMSIVWELARSPRRFKELERLLAPITARTLTRNLRELAAMSLIEREVFDELPPHVEYRLSPLGSALRPHIQALCRWAYENAALIAAPERL